MPRYIHQFAILYEIYSDQLRTDNVGTVGYFVECLSISDIFMHVKWMQYLVCTNLL